MTKNAVSLMDNSYAEDIQDSYYSQSSNKFNVNVPVVHHFQQPETSYHNHFYRKNMMKYKLKLRRLKLYFLKMWVLFKNELDQIMILAKDENITNPINM